MNEKSGKMSLMLLISSHMMRLRLKILNPQQNKRPISHPITHIVLKQHVHHVELSFHGPNFQNLNLQLTFLIGLMNCFLTGKIDLLIYALTKHVKFSKQLLEVRDGKTGQTQLVLLLTHITTTITVPKMKFVGNGVILHEKPVVHQIL